MVLHYSNEGKDPDSPNSIKRQIWAKLNENPLLSPKQLAKLLDLPYKAYANYITKERSNWKYYHKSEQGSKCSNFHCYKAKTRLDKAFSDELRAKLHIGAPGLFVGAGWRLSKSRNRFLEWRGRFGRVIWFETGSVRLHVKRPGNLGQAKQLFSDAFISTRLITDIEVFSKILADISPKSCHFPYETPARLPKITITDFAHSHGIVIKVGDRSHPNAVEVIAEFTTKQIEIQEKVNFVYEAFQAVNSGNKELAGPGLKPLERWGDYSR